MQRHALGPIVLDDSISGALLERKKKLMSNGNGNENGASKADRGALAHNEWVRQQFHFSGVIHLNCLIDCEGSMVWRRRKNMQV
jgi:hypothetical protein